MTAFPTLCLGNTLNHRFFKILARTLQIKADDFCLFAAVKTTVGKKFLGKDPESAEGQPQKKSHTQDDQHQEYLGDDKRAAVFKAVGFARLVPGDIGVVIHRSQKRLRFTLRYVAADCD